VAHRTVSDGSPDSVRCPRLASGELSVLGNRRSRTAIIHRTVRWCTGLSDGAPDCPMVHRTVRWCTGLSGESSAANSSLSGKGMGDVAIIHRTAGGAPDCPVSQRRTRQRSSARSTRDTWLLQWSAGCTGLSGLHRTLSGAPTGPEEQRSAVPDLEGNRAPNMLQWLSGGAPDCPVRPRQKARIAFHVDLQWLLAALGL
jgi:hypothetical protein